MPRSGSRILEECWIHCFQWNDGGSDCCRNLLNKFTEPREKGRKEKG
jgi:hypothetical protein